MNEHIKVLLSGGGTAGHIYPAVAIADEIKRQCPKADILFVGAKDKMEMEKVPQRGYEIKGLWISGLQRKITFDNVLFPIKLVYSLYKAFRIIKKFKPDFVVGTGGFASAPTLKVAQWLKIPYLVQEQNSVAGMVNKWVGKGARKICVAYDNMQAYFPKEKIVKTGNPVRQDLLNLPIKTDKERKTLLVIGGSLGARRINQLIEENLKFFEDKEIDVIWQCGKFYYKEYNKYGNKYVKVCDFIGDMREAYSFCDIIISRAGASSVSELCVVGKPVIFIPSPNVVQDHQTKNAEAIQRSGGAVVISEKDLDSKFKDVFNRIISEEKYAKELSCNIKALALPNATKDIVKFIL